MESEYVFHVTERDHVLLLEDHVVELIDVLKELPFLPNREEG